MFNKGDIVVRTYKSYTGSIIHGSTEGDIFKTIKDTAGKFGFYSIDGGGECRLAHRLEMIAYKRGLRNINNMSWNTPDKPHFVVALGVGFNADLHHVAYREICSYLDFGSQKSNYNDCSYAGYKEGSSRTWTHSPYFDGVRFANVVKFVDYIFEHWVIIDLPRVKEEKPIDNKVLHALPPDTDISKDYCVYLPNKEHHAQYVMICKKGNIPYLDWVKYFTYYGVYGGVSIRLGSAFGVRPYKNYDYFKADRPDVRFGSKEEPVEITAQQFTVGSVYRFIGNTGTAEKWWFKDFTSIEDKSFRGSGAISNNYISTSTGSLLISRYTIELATTEETKWYWNAIKTKTYSDPPVIEEPKKEIRTSIVFPDDGFCRSTNWQLLEFLLTRHEYSVMGGSDYKSEAIGIAWNKDGAWYLKAKSSKYEYQWDYILQLINNLNSNNQLKTSKKDEKLSTKISRPTERRSYHGTRQTTSRREPNPATERRSIVEESSGKTQERIGETLRSKRDRLFGNPKLSGRYSKDS